MARYTVKSVVCDTGVFEDGELKLICNSRSNALLIAAIMEKDGLCNRSDYTFNLIDAKRYLDTNGMRETPLRPRGTQI